MIAFLAWLLVALAMAYFVLKFLKKNKLKWQVREKNEELEAIGIAKDNIKIFKNARKSRDKINNHLNY